MTMQIYKGQEPEKFSNNAPDYRRKRGLRTAFHKRYMWDLLSHIESVPCDGGYLDVNTVGIDTRFDFSLPQAVSAGVSFRTSEVKSGKEVIREYSLLGALLSEKVKDHTVFIPDLTD